MRRHEIIGWRTITIGLLVDTRISCIAIVAGRGNLLASART